MRNKPKQSTDDRDWENDQLPEDIGHLVGVKRYVDGSESRIYWGPNGSVTQHIPASRHWPSHVRVYSPEEN